ncbi:hypothetical protein Dda_9116 [Drechslerella dactyloides]|uniref:Uncharacterized protein n=1 Tax=Drechslerella dactyloides TaxID=74499 RepID=A0AAD6IQL9_DREDA|nr:hypothetical protein Dda_9116 [Drechslerella dactyloides]
MFRSSVNVTDNRTDGGSGVSSLLQQQQPWNAGGSLRKRRAPYADSDAEDDEDDGSALPGVKKQRMAYPAIDTAFISPPVTPTTPPTTRRHNSDVAMEDLDMFMTDSQPNSQTHPRWGAAAAAAGGVHIPAFVAQESNASAMSLLSAGDEEEVIRRPHTPGMIMRDLTRLEVSPSSEIQSRGWSGLAKCGQTHAAAESGGDGKMATAGSKGRFTMGYRADCEKCRSRVPGHWAHPPTMH